MRKVRVLGSRRGNILRNLVPDYMVEQDRVVRGRLQHFIQAWEESSSDAWVLSVLRHGYMIEFQEVPHSSGVRPSPWLSNSVKQEALSQGIHSLLWKNAILEVSPLKRGRGFNTIIFLVAKPT
ncbi:hypothetical protein NDU88_006821 [Pleurodeles waltl]|uniref:Uncharacterized protein n=1 Tax=Pleurodeles waltl TaxID=8319 RepID=A0AAV7UR55_PLEWA|nr:hypothetical protein NDU88_006821 [Pleurodeles waltl]